jgi:hypothetical protein
LRLGGNLAADGRERGPTLDIATFLKRNGELVGSDQDDPDRRSEHAVTYQVRVSRVREPLVLGAIWLNRPDPPGLWRSDELEVQRDPQTDWWQATNTARGSREACPYRVRRVVEVPDAAGHPRSHRFAHVLELQLHPRYGAGLIDGQCLSWPDFAERFPDQFGESVDLGGITAPADIGQDRLVGELRMQDGDLLHAAIDLTDARGKPTWWVNTRYGVRFGLTRISEVSYDSTWDDRA